MAVAARSRKAIKKTDPCVRPLSKSSFRPSLLDACPGICVSDFVHSRDNRHDFYRYNRSTSIRDMVFVFPSIFNCRCIKQVQPTFNQCHFPHKIIMSKIFMPKMLNIFKECLSYNQIVHLFLYEENSTSKTTCLKSSPLPFCS